MKKNIYIAAFMSIGMLLISSCGGGGSAYPSNKYLGQLPAMALDYRQADHTENEKADILKKFDKEAANYIGKTIPCTIDKGIPLEVAENLTIKAITIDGIEYAGKLHVTKDIPVTPGIIKDDFGDLWAKQYIIGLVMFDGDKVWANSGDQMGTIFYHEELTGDKRNFIDYYFSIFDRRKFENDKLYKWTDRKSLHYVSALAYHDADLIPIANSQNPYDGINFWNKGDVVEVNGFIPLDHWLDELTRFTSIQYTLAF